MSDDHERRIRSLEDWRNEMNTTGAVETVERRHLNERFNKLEGRLSKIDGHITRVVWLIVSAIITGVIGFVMAGGISGG